ncbi:hypothetical protein B0H15DRAFT_805602 [Mycena belliarum]|uniref:Uncharacterized protein n=1 Tax=Mycena belliarum TaxID=1033014 RepID=A0AAD6XJZ5_9AGAR|nr:hypothetical protein B0H15DRAFT_805602 [Mycena belliae]
MSGGTVLRRIVVDDTDPAIQYGPTGWYSADPVKLNAMGNFGPVYNTTSHGTSTSGSTLSFPFNGTSVSVFGTIAIATDASNATDPTWTCLVDEIPIENPNPTFKYAENNWLLCDQSKISPGSHTLTIQVQSKGQPFYLDNIMYTPLPDVRRESAVLEYTNVDPAVSFGSGWRGWGAQNITQVNGAQVALNFHGTSVSLRGYIPQELPHVPSSASYSIDGGPPVKFTLPGLPEQSVTQYNVIMLTTNTLTPTAHNLVITYEGSGTQTPLVAATFYVTNTSAPASAPAASTAASESSATPSSTTLKNGTPTAAIAGGTVGVLAALALIAGLVFWCHRRRRRSAENARRQSANPFMATTEAAAAASSAGATYTYSAVPGPAADPHTHAGTASHPHFASAYTSSQSEPASPFAAPSASSGSLPRPARAPGTYPHPYMHPASPLTEASSSAGGSHTQSPSAGSASEAHAPPGLPTPAPSEGYGSLGKHERERAASEALPPLVPLRARDVQRPAVVRHHQDSGVRLTPGASVASGLHIVELPPDYTAN